MTILFGGGEDSEFTILSGSVSTNTLFYRSTYARCALSTTTTLGIQHLFSGALKTYLDAQPSGDKDFWYGYRWVGGGGFVSGNVHLNVYDSSGTPKSFMRLKSYTSGNSVLETSTDGTYAGGGFTAYPASAIDQPGDGSPAEYVFRIKIHATLGQILWYINGGLWFASPVGDTTGLCVGSPSKVIFGCSNSNGKSYISEVIATSADDPRVGLSLATLAYTADGDNVGWSGGVATVNELVKDTSTVLKTAVASVDSCFVATDLPTLAAGVAVRGVINSGEWRTSAGAPQSVAGYLRIGGVNYAATSQTVDTVPTTRQFIWQSSPATSTTFAEAETNAAQFGMRSVA